MRLSFIPLLMRHHTFTHLCTILIELWKSVIHKILLCLSLKRWLCLRVGFEHPLFFWWNTIIIKSWYASVSYGFWHRWTYLKLLCIGRQICFLWSCMTSGFLIEFLQKRRYGSFSLSRLRVDNNTHHAGFNQRSRTMSRNIYKHWSPGSLACQLQT